MSINLKLFINLKHCLRKYNFPYLKEKEIENVNTTKAIREMESIMQKNFHNENLKNN